MKKFVRGGLFGYLLVGFTIIFPGEVSPVISPGDMEARIWMTADSTSRAMYVAGFLGGIVQIIRLFDYDLRSSIGRAMTIQELSERVYLDLLAHAELRSGPIGPIILNALGPYISLTDRAGNPIPVR